MSNQQTPLETITANGFEDQAILTASPQYHGDLVPRAELESALARAIEALQDLDRIKKSLFYGKEYSVDATQTPDENVFVSCRGLPRFFGALPPEVGTDVLHGMIGAATECGELLEALQATLTDPAQFDIVNVREEVFDTQWYHALLAKALKFTFQEGQRNVIAKLRTRFPNRFTEFDAKNRNLAAERTVLESYGSPTGRIVNPQPALMELPKTGQGRVSPEELRKELAALHDESLRMASEFFSRNNGVNIPPELLDFVCWMATQRDPLVIGASHELPVAIARVEEWAKHRAQLKTEKAA